MKTTHIWQSTALVLLAIATAAYAGDKEAPSPETYQLAYKFKPGEVVRWEVIHRATIKTTIQGTTQTAQTRSESVKVWQFDKTAPVDQFGFVHSVASVKMSNEISGRAKVEYDSEKDKTPPAGYEQVAAAIGVPLTTVRIDNSGKVLRREQKHKQPGATDDTPITLPLPEKAIPVGHVWTEPHSVQVTLKGGGRRQITTRRRFELKEVAGNLATIAIDYQVLTPIQDPAIESQLVQRVSRGQAKFDIERGRIVSQQLDIDKKILGISGAASSMHYLMRFTERLLAPGERVAKKLPPPAGPEPLPVKK